MIHLSVSDDHPDRTEVLERLRDLSLGFELASSDIPGTLVFRENELILKDLPAILQHLDEIAGELHLWYYCSC